MEADHGAAGSERLSAQRQEHPSALTPPAVVSETIKGLWMVLESYGWFLLGALVVAYTIYVQTRPYFDRINAKRNTPKADDVRRLRQEALLDALAAKQHEQREQREQASSAAPAAPAVTRTPSRGNDAPSLLSGGGRGGPTYRPQRACRPTPGGGSA